ncbi:mannitol-1-phosphate 5-dehydrogenase [Streptococcus gallolyticus subsp. gallolyticus]|uniref:mannitol-1-phosphate 5-dehydrogenase n=1 Tax=Streptococcus gallolyticus TaxID=315405 RepID=UPI0020009834|nr:mannitol-1-phosphate 5-dehydrogenase [Streptococcus gallolyticus]MCQ9216677.1 mannitol-1-phosphate 5-dehydrogenase [Streptococcus gallolyticus]MCY7155378.1 mannitol-1-phosphate 5-dehydrogenase [Streptococcus gallolyticus subsp. gallolyticus]MCY7174134.1 mannitol-1-phosphate 5-dehydrogenase [Streptococcus gallolyticus subsp. gallolyticus]MCY7176254.1 mannitol-1-phosphate 5-dehydrogenase [Streptococcus gallolyticus subsp. gallolyticus]MCY7180708.1 mannitol-1-phosphate 5-dehydrogenase [Strepto
MKNAVHFGAGNIGRGFIGDILSKNNVAITFVDVNERVIDELNKRHSYEIEVAEEGQPHIVVKNVSGVNNAKNPDEVIKAIASADIITTAIGPNILPFIAELIAKGIEARKAAGNNTPIDVLACENMIGGSQYLYQEVKKYLSADSLAFAEQYVGFPNAAVDRIVPAQTHEDPLFVVVEPFNEWVVETSRMKNPTFKLTGVHYEKDLEPFIERKLFSVNSGHATSAYTGAFYGAKTILEALKDDRVKAQVEAVLGEIRSLLIAKWNFDEQALIDYHKIIISRFENPFIVDDVNRVARTPIRKLGYDERFIRPIRELKERQLSYQNLLKTIAFVFHYNDSNDEQSVQLQELLATKPLPEVVADVTGLTDQDLISEIVDSIENL